VTFHQTFHSWWFTNKLPNSTIEVSTPYHKLPFQTLFMVSDDTSAAVIDVGGNDDVGLTIPSLPGSSFNDFF
jgi:hypothetical protein